MEGKIILEGITLDEFMDNMRILVRQEIAQAERQRLVPISLKEACRLLEISRPALSERMKKEEINVIYASDIERLKLKYPRYSRGK